MKSQEPTLATRLIALGDVARLAGVEPSAVSNWRRRYGNDFPQPVRREGRQLLFDEPEIRAWLEEHRPRATTVDEDSIGDSLADLGDYDDVLEVVLSLLCLTILAPEEIWTIAAAGTTNDIVESLIAQLSEKVERQHDMPDLFLPLRDGPVDGPAVGAVLRRLRPELDRMGLSGRHVDRALLAGSFEYLLDRRSRARARRHTETRTADWVAELVVRLAHADHGRVLDPAAGEGGFLLAAHRAAEASPSLYGWELSPEALRIARQRMLVHGIDASLVQRDSLGEPSYEGFHADSVICDPPYSLRVRPEQWAASDHRWRYGIPAPNADLGWVQLALHHLVVGGRAAVLTGMGALWRPGHEARIRLGLVQESAVEAVIGLPSGTALHTDIRLALWLLRRPEVRAAPHDDRVLFVDADSDEGFRRLPQGVRYMNTLSLDDGRALSARIVDAVEGWREDPTAPLPNGFASAIAIPDLAVGDVNLSPDRLVHRPASRGELKTAVSDAIAKHTAVHAQLSTLSPLKPPRLEAARAGRCAKVWELLAAGRIEIISGTRAETNETGRGIAALGPWSFNHEPVRYIESDDSSPRVQPGDVVVMPSRGWFSAFVNDEADVGLVAPLQAIRIREPALDGLEELHPVVLAAAVTADRGARTGTAGRRSVKNVEVPLLGRTEAEELASFLTELKREQDLSDEAAAMRSRLTELVLTALTGS